MMTTSDYQTIGKWLEDEYFGDVKGPWWRKHCQERDNPRGCCNCSFTCLHQEKLKKCKWIPRLFTLAIPFVVFCCFNRDFKAIDWLDCEAFCFNELQKMFS